MKSKLDRRMMLSTVVSTVTTIAMPTFSQAVVPNQLKSIPKSVWVWKCDFDEYGRMADFARSIGIERLLISIRNQQLEELLKSDRRARAGMEALSPSGCKVLVVAGESNWLDGQEVPSVIDRIIKVQRTYGVLEGVHLDVEPQTTLEWKRGARREILGRYIRLLRNIRAVLPNQLSLEAALHPSYASVDLDGKSGLGAALEYLSGVALMSYRETANQAIRSAKLALEVLATGRVGWWMGIKIDAGSGTSLGSGSRDRFISEAEMLHATLSAGQFSDSYKGLAIQSYRELKEALG